MNIQGPDRASVVEQDQTARGSVAKMLHHVSGIKGVEARVHRRNALTKAKAVEDRVEVVRVLLDTLQVTGR